MSGVSVRAKRPNFKTNVHGKQASFPYFGDYYSTITLAFYGIINSKILIMALRNVIDPYCDEDKRSIVFLKVDTFHKLGMHFSFRQRLNSFASIGDNSGLVILRTTGILFGPVACLGSSLEASRALIEILQRLCSVKNGNQINGVPYRLV